jgi:hypothetical protein
VLDLERVGRAVRPAMDGPIFRVLLADPFVDLCG